MIADADLKVWLDTQAQAGQTVLIPYVKSVKDIQVNYSLSVKKSGKSGTSSISQGGNVNAVAAQPTALSKMSMNLQKDDTCSIELVLRNGDKELGTYSFDCPR
jgi:hypothetical protein